jgi:hypothetical protein
MQLGSRSIVSSEFPDTDEIALIFNAKFQQGAHGSLPIHNDRGVVSFRQTVRRITSALGLYVAGKER